MEGYSQRSTKASYEVQLRTLLPIVSVLEHENIWVAVEGGFRDRCLKRSALRGAGRLELASKRGEVGDVGEGRKEDSEKRVISINIENGKKDPVKSLSVVTDRMNFRHLVSLIEVQQDVDHSSKVVNS